MKLTAEEVSLVRRLGDCFSEFAELDEHHPDDVQDFKRAIHEAQRIIACRPSRRANPEVLR